MFMFVIQIIMALDKLNDFVYINQISKPMANHLNEFIQKLRLKQLDENQNLYFVQKNLGVKPSSLFVALSIFILIVALTSNATSIVVNIVCSLIPAYFTFLALQSKQSDDNIKYLTYWIIYALIETISPFLSLILTSFLYILLRIGVTIVLIHPSFNLTVKVYREYIEPEIKKYESSIDQRIQQGKSAAQNQYKKFTRN